MRKRKLGNGIENYSERMGKNAELGNSSEFSRDYNNKKEQFIP